MLKFVKESFINAAPERVFEFHLLPDAFERLMPSWENANIIQKADVKKVGSRAVFEQKLFGLFSTRWVAEHTRFEPPKMFEDVQISGPFRYWRHQHIVRPHENGAILHDEIFYDVPLGILGRPFAPFLVKPKLEKMFAYRHEVTRRWCEDKI